MGEIGRSKYEELLAKYNTLLNFTKTVASGASADDSVKEIMVHSYIVMAEELLKDLGEK